LIFSCLYLNAQVLSESAARAELQKRNISEERFREELLKRGIDLNKINPNNPQEIARIEGEVKAVLSQLEKENSLNNTNPNDTTDIDIVKTKTKEIKQSQATENQKPAGEVETKKDTIDIQKDILIDTSIYGHHVFKDKSLKVFNTSDAVKPTANYVLGPGDVIAVSIFGYSHANFALEISSEGYIQPTQLPRFYLTGLTLEQAEKLLMTNLRNRYLFKSEDFKLTVVSARNITVNIFGEVQNNGSFNISAINTAVNALVAAGGPNKNGSIRQIKLIRGNKSKTIDLYKFINDPTVSQEFYLQENDYIQVPVIEKLVQIKGGIIRPMKYELLDTENLNDLIKYAGGLTANAVRKNIQITRIENDLTKILDVNIDDVSFKDFILKNGDIVDIKIIDDKVSNVVSLNGAVEQVGDFSFVDGMKLTDLLKKTKLKEDAITDIAYLRRFNQDKTTVRYQLININDAIKNPNSEANITLQKGDVINIRSYSDFAEQKFVTIDGAIKIPGRYQIGPSSNLKVADLFFLSGDVTDDAASFAYLLRKKGEDLTTQEYFFIDLVDLAKNKNSKYNYELNANDSVFVYRAAEYFDKAYVKIDGAVRKPAEFLYNPTLSVKDVILLGGGLKLEASPNRIEIFRLDLGQEKKSSTLAAKLDISDDPSLEKAAEFKLQPYDLIYVRYAPEFEMQRTVKLDGEVIYPGEYALLKDNTKLSDVIEQSGGVTLEAYLEGATLYRADDNTGFVIINLKEALKNKKSLHNIILQKGDIINIPKLSSIISITGATNYDELYPERLFTNGKINIAFQKGKDALYYIDNYAGGLDEKADKKRIVVEHKNGQIEKVKNYLFFKKYPEVKEGSTIKVPYKREKTKEEKAQQKDINWGDVLKDSIAQATAILSLILLIRSVD
jgi:protein involved in polysaccharide export with SLBB domain